ncbi:hypothetical protein OSTOST_07938, partial [Ostertagia ostertagi]
YLNGTGSSTADTYTALGGNAAFDGNVLQYRYNYTVVAAQSIRRTSFDGGFRLRVWEAVRNRSAPGIHLQRVVVSRRCIVPMGGLHFRYKALENHNGKKTSRHGTRRNIVFVSSTAIMSQCQLAKWFFLFVYFIIAGLCNWGLWSPIRMTLPRGNLCQTFLFSLFPEQEWASRLGDYMVLATLTCFCLLLVFHQSRAIVARRFLFIAAPTLYLSALFHAPWYIKLTSGYENNEVRCREQVNITFSIFLSRVAEQLIRAGFQEKTKMLCGDMLFSGHSLTMWIPHLFTAIGMICLIISRTHYTIDIFIAYWLSNFVFRTYHAFCEVDIFMERRKSVLHGLWMLWIVEWLEDDIVPG